MRSVGQVQANQATSTGRLHANTRRMRARAVRKDQVRRNHAKRRADCKTSVRERRRPTSARIALRTAGLMQVQGSAAGGEHDSGSGPCAPFHPTATC